MISTIMLHYLPSYHNIYHQCAFDYLRKTIPCRIYHWLLRTTIVLYTIKHVHIPSRWFICDRVVYIRSSTYRIREATLAHLGNCCPSCTPSWSSCLLHPLLGFLQPFFSVKTVKFAGLFLNLNVLKFFFLCCGRVPQTKRRTCTNRTKLVCPYLPSDGISTIGL